jgi:phospholipase C
VTWGWFEGGFRPTGTQDGKAVCGASHTGSNGKSKSDYIPHHAPFQYYAQTSNPHHVPPGSVAAIGKDDAANHNYDLDDFWAAVDAGGMPEVSYLKAPAYRDGHPGYSDPLAEQTFLVETLNRLQKRPEWKDTAVIIAYDDSDGWYDHVMPPIVSQSAIDGVDALDGPGSCGEGFADEYQGRCGYGLRMPLMVLSPYAKSNFVDHTVTDQASILRFIEDNWSLEPLGDQSLDVNAGPLAQLFDFTRKPAPPLLLDPKTGQPL